MQQDNRPKNFHSRPPPTPTRAGACLRKEISKDLLQPLELSPARQLFFATSYVLRKSFRINGNFI